MNTQDNPEQASIRYILIIIELGVIFFAGLSVCLCMKLLVDIEFSIANYIYPSFLVAIMSIVFSAALGLYNNRAEILSWETFSRYLLNWILVVSNVALIAVLVKINYSYSRVWFVFTITSSFTLCLFVRVLISHYLRSQRRQRFAQLNLLVLGNEDATNSLIERHKQLNDGWFRNVDTYHWRSDAIKQNINIVKELMLKSKYSQVWISGGQNIDPDIGIIRDLFRTDLVQVKYFPDFSFLPVVRPELSRQADLPVVDLSMQPLAHMDRWFKSLIDRLFALSVIVVGAPVFLLIALGVKFSSKGPIFYSQERLTINGNSFKMLKFRSMPVGVEAHSGPVWAKEGENRATPFGQFLRRTSLDELPQFINVLKGEMSVVGPRPERPQFVEKFQHTIPDYMQKHYVKAGITGWAQVNGYRGNTSLEMRVELDLFYIRNWSIWFDFKIMFLTVFKGLIAETAY